MGEPIKVLVVDDSALVRQLLTELLDREPDLRVVGAAPDPYVARGKIKQLRPDVLTLDVEMPRMDGLTFLRNLMRLHPMPVVMVSSLTERGADVTLEALALGAVDFVTKPRLDVAEGLRAYAQELAEKVRMAARARIRPRAATTGTLAPVPPRHSADAVLPPPRRKHFRTTDRIIAIGASTGGTEAIREVLEAFPPDAPGVVVTQHIPAAFSAPFAARLDRSTALRVKEAEDGDLVLPGHALVAPGDRHLIVTRDGARYRCRLSGAAPVNRHRPSVDVMFRSLAESAGPNAVGVLLTGMGEDGARGLEEMHRTGARTLAQDEATSVVWGMPGAAVARGCVDEVLPLGRIAARALAAAGRARAGEVREVEA